MSSVMVMALSMVLLIFALIVSVMAMVIVVTMMAGTTITWNTNYGDSFDFACGYESTGALNVKAFVRMSFYAML